MENKFEDKIIEVCSECGQATCWQGIFMCFENYSAGTEKFTVAELRDMNEGKGNGEHECYWSDEHLTEVCGDPAPHGYRTR